MVTTPQATPTPSAFDFYLSGVFSFLGIVATLLVFGDRPVPSALWVGVFLAVAFTTLGIALRASRKAYFALLASATINIAVFLSLLAA